MSVHSRRATGLRAKTFVSLSIIGFSCCFTIDARATGEDKKACAIAAEEAQRDRNEGKLSAAKTQLEICTRAVCPAFVRKDCEPWMAEVEKAMPTIVVSAKDDGGADVLDVKVSVDGAVITDKLDGSAIPVDPGAHLFRFERQSHDADPVEEKLVIKESEKDRKIEVKIHGHEPLKPAPEPPRSIEPVPPASPPIAGYVASGVAVAGLGVGAVFYVLAKKDINDLQGQCAPHCKSSQVDPIQTKIIVSDIALGVGVVAAAAAVYFFVSHASHASASTQVGSLAPTLSFTF